MHIQNPSNFEKYNMIRSGTYKGWPRRNTQTQQVTSPSNSRLITIQLAVSQWRSWICPESLSLLPPFPRRRHHFITLPLWLFNVQLCGFPTSLSRSALPLNPFFCSKINWIHKWEGMFSETFPDVAEIWKSGKSGYCEHVQIVFSCEHLETWSALI